MPPIALAIGDAGFAACDRDRGTLAALAESAWPTLAVVAPDCDLPSSPGAAIAVVARERTAPDAKPNASVTADGGAPAGAVAILRGRRADGKSYHGAAFHVGDGLWVSAAHVVASASAADYGYCILPESLPE